jgi:hypothetical protein
MRFSRRIRDRGVLGSNRGLVVSLPADGTVAMPQEISLLTLCKSRLLSLKASYFRDDSVTAFSQKRHRTQQRLVNARTSETSLLQTSFFHNYQRLGQPSSQTFKKRTAL